MAIILGIDLLLIELELIHWLKVGIMFSIFDFVMYLLPLWIGVVLLPFIILPVWGLGMLFYVVLNFIPPNVRAEMRRGRVPLVLILGPEGVRMERPPFIDILTKIVLDVVLIWMCWDLEGLAPFSRTLFGPYHSRRMLEPFLRLFLFIAGHYSGNCLIINTILAFEAYAHDHRDRDD